ncbi:putative surface protein with fasciclin (FAS1) repeats [Gillisia mitskevichiae]|uniref:Putative surface protein with fasciclin (FAS1) repeats n=1 Tax=Gillisia mitskevichiae TaxID=270921 RepID=A0A495PUW1_9FLAO|nr:fasciclin domain-containing protein [Gillisia mitskevichiae]RKS53555.1 putative surface protein with fasciclin (FAS1) repeats [Gillisia mitskevichiae]
MKLTSKIFKPAVMAFLALGMFACNDDDDANVPMVEDNTIADFVSTNDNYSSLAAALEAADLTSTLDGTTKYTVFAPNNEAFSEFLAANNFDALDDVPVDVLKQVLLNHVQMGEIMAADLSTGYIESMAKGPASDENLSMYINVGDNVVINGVSTVTTTNIEVDNGIIHAVDQVIGLPDITTFAIADPTFDILQAALTREEDYTFVDILQSTGDASPFTVFAPTNDAFVALLDELDVDSLDDIDADLLATVLSYHVVSGDNVRAEDLTDGMMVTTFETGEITINVGASVTITDENERTSTVVLPNVQATNGVIHAIDQVLLPASED